MHWFPWNPLWDLTLLGISVTIIFLLAPVEDQNKPLDETEQRVYKKRSRRIAVILSATAISFLVLNLYSITCCIIIAVMASAVMLVLERV